MKKLVYLFLAMLMVGAAVKAAGLVETLQSPGPFTVFAPTNEAFAKLPTGAVDALFKPEDKDTPHKGADLPRRRRKNVQQGSLESPQGRQRHRHSKDGGWLKANARGKDIILIDIDEKGGMFKLTIADVNQSNGVIHVVDTVLLPN